MTPEGLEFLREWEGCRLEVYNDAAGYPTIGVGHLICDGEDYAAGITMDEALELLAADVAEHEAAVDAAIDLPLELHQKDALTSLCFNIGCGAFRRSTLVRRINADRFDDVPAQLARWNKAGGREVTGLIRRRQAEADLFTSGTYVDP